MKKLFLTLIFVIFYNYSYSQCPTPTVISYTNGSTANYTGELNDNCNPDGEGKLTHNDPEYFIESQSGTWKNNKLNGKGIVIHRNWGSFEGIYVDDKLTKGVFIRNSNSIIWKYEGGFNGFNFQGEGNSYRETSQNIIIQEGFFISDKFANGLETNTSKINGVIIKSEYVNGISTIKERNDINSYNKKDIIGDEESVEIDLIQRGSIFDARIAYDVELEIGGVTGDWILDTGAMSFRIGKTLFNRLKNEGVLFTDLNKKIVSTGIGGSANGKLVILDEVKIGGYIVKNVVATVALDDNNSLLGTGFLLKFSNVIWKMRENKLVLFK